MTSFLEGIQELGLSLLDFVYPLHCLVCGVAVEDADQYLCEACWREVLIRPMARCQRCSCPLGKREAVCTNCAGWDPVFERALVLGPFTGAMQQAIHALKFLQQPDLGTKLGCCLARAPDFAEVLQEVDVLVPVPLHPARERERGYNQSLCIARGVAEVVNRPWTGGF